MRWLTAIVALASEGFLLWTIWASGGGGPVAHSVESIFLTLTIGALVVIALFIVEETLTKRRL